MPLGQTGPLFCFVVIEFSSLGDRNGSWWGRFSRWILRAKTAGTQLESRRYLSKWLFISISIGIVAGFGSVLFFLGIEWCTRFFLGTIVGYMPPVAVGEGVPKITQARATIPLSKIAHPGPVVLHPDDHLDVALERISTRGLSWAPVFEDGRIAGKLTVKDAIAVYRATLEKSVRRTTELPGDAVVIEARLHAASTLVGKSLREAGLPRDTLLVSISRNGGTIFPRADTRLEAGDLITIMADPSSEQALRTFLGESISQPAGDKQTG